MSKCKWCGVDYHFLPDRELGGGTIIETKTGKPHVCKPFKEWEEQMKLNGPSLSQSRYELWLLGPEEANRRVDLQKKARQPLLPFWNLKKAKIVELESEERIE